MTFEVCILAGGESSRMGENKARLRIGRQTMLGTIRSEAKKLGVKVRVIRRDLVERCGPLGGIYTGLKTTRCDAVLFLACDMPLVSARLMEKISSNLAPQSDAVFVQSQGVGFPFLLRKKLLPAVEQQIAAGEFSIHKLCQKLNAEIVQPDESEKAQLLNVNTPGDLEILKETLAARSANP